MLLLLLLIGTGPRGYAKRATAAAASTIDDFQLLPLVRSACILEPVNDVVTVQRLPATTRVKGVQLGYVLNDLRT